MKISKLFHWLYCLVMFLPVLFIPIMAIYSHRHTIDNYSVVRAEDSIITNTYHLNQFCPNVDRYWTNNGENSYFEYSDSYVGEDLVLSCNVFEDDGELILDSPLYNFTVGDIIYIYTFVRSDDSMELSFTWYDHDDNDLDLNLFQIDGSKQKLDYYFVLDEDNPSYYFEIYTIIPDSFGGDFNFYFTPFNFFNLTEIFGSGNEPSLVDCQNIFTQQYYNYNVDYTYTVTNTVTNTVTYNDTDIGSQFVYDTYNVVNKYFNYDKVFNFGDLYTWLQNNFFSGNAPLGFFIFWHLLIYWLLTSILWLLFDVLMYVPQLVHRWLDKASVS